MRSLKARIEELESEIREKDEEVRTMRENGGQANKAAVNGEDNDAIKVSLESLYSLPLNGNSAFFYMTRGHYFLPKRGSTL